MEVLERFQQNYLKSLPCNNLRTDSKVEEYDSNPEWESQLQRLDLLTDVHCSPVKHLQSDTGVLQKKVSGSLLETSFEITAEFDKAVKPNKPLIWTKVEVAFKNLQAPKHIVESFQRYCDDLNVVTAFSILSQYVTWSSGRTAVYEHFVANFPQHVECPNGTTDDLIHVKEGNALISVQCECVISDAAELYPVIEVMASSTKNLQSIGMNATLNQYTMMAKTYGLETALHVLIQSIVGRNATEDNQLAEKENIGEKHSSKKSVKKSFTKTQLKKYQQKVTKLKDKHLTKLVKTHEGFLREIFEGKRENRRHEQYKQPGSSRRALNFYIQAGFFSDEQIFTISKALKSSFCRDSSSSSGYVNKVLLPEAIVLLHMTKLSLSEENTLQLFSELDSMLDK